MQTGREFIDLFWTRATYRWQFALEENEILFPQLRRPRQQLHVWQQEISEGLSEFQYTIWTATHRKQGVDGVQRTATRIREQGVLVAYLRVYLQNLALSQIVGRSQLVPAPRDVTLLRLIAAGSDLEFGYGSPRGRAQLAWRRLRHGRFQVILEDEIQDQQALSERMREAAGGQTIPDSDCWVQGEGKHMAVQILDARTGRGLWLHIGPPDEILSKFAAWIRSAANVPR